MRPSTWLMTRTDAMNRSATGMPMMRIERLKVSEIPTTVQVK